MPLLRTLRAFTAHVGPDNTPVQVPAGESEQPQEIHDHWYTKLHLAPESVAVSKANPNAEMRVALLRSDDLSRQLESMTTAHGDLANALARNEQERDGLEAKIATLQSERDSLASQVQTLTAERDDLAGQVEELTAPDETETGSSETPPTPRRRGRPPAQA